MLHSFTKVKKFPTKWKTARTILRAKFLTPTELSDYRQKSVLSLLPNICEKLVMKQVVESFENLNLYVSTHPGY